VATVYKRNDFYYAKFFDHNGRRTSRNTGVTSKREALRIAAKYEADAQELRRKNQDRSREYAHILETAVREAETGALTLARAEQLRRRLRDSANPDFREVSVKEWFHEWVKNQRPHVSDSTIDAYTSSERRMTEALGPRKAKAPLSELTTADIRMALEKIAKKVKAATANMDLRAFRRVLEAACGEGLISSNAAKPVRPLPTIDSTERAPFTAEEVRKLIDGAASDEWRGLILIAAHTGLRMGDVTSLGRDNIEGSDIVIRPQKTKRSKATIRIPMTPPVIAWIGDKKGPFFPTLNKRGTSTLSTVFANLLKRIGIAREVTLPGGIKARRSFHSLRHSFTSWLAEADVHSDIRRKLTGHRSAGIHDLYTHYDKGLRRAIEELPDLSTVEQKSNKA
jgi:integrase